MMGIALQQHSEDDFTLVVDGQSTGANSFNTNQVWCNEYARATALELNGGSYSHASYWGCHGVEITEPERYMSRARVGGVKSLEGLRI